MMEVKAKYVMQLIHVVKDLASPSAVKKILNFGYG